MKTFCRKCFLSKKRVSEIIIFMKSVTVHACDDSKRCRKAEFRDYIWENSFMVWRNLSYKNSFNAVAKVWLKETAHGTEVDLEIGMNVVVFIFMCLWCAGVLFFGIEMTVYLASGQGGKCIWIPVGILLFFFFIAYLFLRFGFYKSMKELKKRMFDIFEV